jgi:hypothetical protein
MGKFSLKNENLGKFDTGFFLKNKNLTQRRTSRFVDTGTHSLYIDKTSKVSFKNKTENMYSNFFFINSKNNTHHY